MRLVCYSGPAGNVLGPKLNEASNLLCVHHLKTYDERTNGCYSRLAEKLESLNNCLFLALLFDVKENGGFRARFLEYVVFVEPSRIPLIMLFRLRLFQALESSLSQSNIAPSVLVKLNQALRFQRCQKLI